MPTRPDLRPVPRPVEPPPDHYRLDPDEPLVRHEGTGTLVTAVTLLVLLTVLCLLAVG